MVVCSDADISEPDIDTDGELVEELLDASDDDEIEKVQVSQRSKYQWTRKVFTPTPTPFHSGRTKIYAGQCGYHNFSVSAIDIEPVTGILLTTGITSLPKFRMYWTANTCLDFVADLISRNRSYSPVFLKTEPSKWQSTVEHIIPYTTD
ncbi:hypothetical protein T01_11868 [Trichinella spiralis]|uniref:PiggyBac transposable element-derived protein domain-containing protein n=1 Tax=Trichinella spiralis TaxID=6334 RepID=A0A0V1AQX9_TRISP|nr:hypothetical protein T01_11868 [Trichinella spiralis]